MHSRTDVAEEAEAIPCKLKVSAPASFYLRRWAAGFAIATLIMWAVSWEFLNTAHPYQLDPAIGCDVPLENWPYRHRSEGWADTRYGKQDLTPFIYFRF